MLKKLSIALLTLVALTSIAQAWEIRDVVYNTTTNQLEISFDFNPFELLFSFLIGGNYVKNMTENIISGNYSVSYAGYDHIVLNVHGNLSFSIPVNVKITNNSETYFMLNVTQLNPKKLN